MAGDVNKFSFFNYLQDEPLKLAEPEVINANHPGW